MGKSRQKELASCWGSLELKILSERGKGHLPEAIFGHALPCILILPPGAAGAVEKPTRLGSDDKAAPGHQYPFNRVGQFLATKDEHPAPRYLGGEGSMGVPHESVSQIPIFIP